MSEKRYRICLSAPLGRRDGSMVIRERNGKIDGWLNVMNERNRFSGTVSTDGQLKLSGMLRTLLSTVQYTATGKVSGRNIMLNLKTVSGAYYPISGEELNIDDEIL